MAEIWVLLLGDIDLSTGYVAAIGATVAAITISSVPSLVVRDAARRA
jgi:ribose/xylose/arabinose/galactoside ABC-type transport system permease subunit